MQQSWSVNTLHLYLCPPCLLKAHARATTCPVALLATGTHSMDMMSHPNMVDICLHSSCKRERRGCNFDRSQTVRDSMKERYTARTEEALQR